MLTVACLSQKGGVGKSTIARLIARTYAKADWDVKIADFNVKQKTSVDWSALRMSMSVKPSVAAEAYNDVNKAFRNQADIDLLVLDGRPEADPQTIQIAKEADVVLVPTGVSADDLVPQVRFAQELKMRSVSDEKVLFILNKTTDSPAADRDAKNFIRAAAFRVAEHTLPMKTAFVNAHNTGKCLSETEYDTLNDRAEKLAQEVVRFVNTLKG